MINFENVKEIAKIAYEKDEMFEFLMGYNGYKLMAIDAPVDVPTDWTKIIPNGIYAIYEELSDENIIKKYQQAIMKAIRGTCTELWCAVNILYFQKNHEKKGKSPFVISKEVTSDVTQIIVCSRAELEKLFPYGKNGWNMYEDILRLNHNFKTDWKDFFLN